jgi:DedD protein
MQKVFGTTLEPIEKRRDKELTLGPTTLILLGLGLFALCGVCFVFGYAVGQHGSPATPAAGSLTVKSIAAAAQSQNPGLPTKPAPSQNSFQPKQATAAPPAADARNDAADTIAESGRAARSAPSSEHAAQGSPPAPAPITKAAAAAVVQAALPGQGGGAQTLAGGPLVRPALTQIPTQTSTQPGTWMVQIAAVSHPEDADVLVSALRKHGYAVAVHRDPVDALIHVQVGPFATHTDAAAMRQKLLNDGYNAIVQP